jgi:hypothetical protein
MRKRDPNDLVDRFQTELATSVNQWQSLVDVAGDARLARRATMDAFNRAAIAFELFRSDFHIAAITRDASAFEQAQQRRLEDVLRKDTPPRLALITYSRVTLPKHPTLAQVTELLDATGGNLSISPYARWKKIAERDLADPWKSKVTNLPWDLRGVADAVISIRNAVAHQSPRSLTGMSEALKKLTAPSHTGLQRPKSGVTLSGIPSYLHGSTSSSPSASRRVERYHALLREVGEALRI